MFEIMKSQSGLAGEETRSWHWLPTQEPGWQLDRWLIQGIPLQTCENNVRKIRITPAAVKLV